MRIDPAVHGWWLDQGKYGLVVGNWSYVHNYHMTCWLRKCQLHGVKIMTFESSHERVLELDQTCILEICPYSNQDKFTRRSSRELNSNFLGGFIFFTYIIMFYITSCRFIYENIYCTLFCRIWSAWRNITIRIYALLQWFYCKIFDTSMLRWLVHFIKLL